MKKEIFILAGPASIGKTTYLEKLNLPKESTASISRDDILYRMLDKYKYEYNELYTFPPADAAIGSLIPGFEHFGKVIETPQVAKHVSPVSYEILDGVNAEIHHTYYNEFEIATKDPKIQYITLDRVHMLKQERSVYFPFLKHKREDFYVTAILFNFIDADALDVISAASEKRRQIFQAKGMTRIVPRNIQENMIKRFEEITLEEGFDAIQKVDTLPALREFIKK